jgi:biopolymer transport protein ExbB
MTGVQDLIDGVSRGGPVMWLIAVLSVVTLALVLWKVWRFFWLGVWGGSDMGPALAAWAAGDLDGAEALMRGARGLRARVARVAMAIRRDRRLSDGQAREEVTRLALAELRDARAGLRALDVIAAIAPLLGLFGTVLGMIEAFRGLEAAGAQVHPGVVAGGVWQALLTTAAGMAVAIPAAIAGAWFEAVADRVQAEMEDTATRIFTRGPTQGGA